jgi:ABC-type multidrug transport system fused ATPase/permease subunit
MRIYVSAILLLLGGCLYIPSGLNPFGTPIDKVERVEAKRDDAREKLLKNAQEQAHKTATAISEPASERRDEVAKGYALETMGSLDQALGAPLAGESAQWRKVVSDLLSENSELRKKAEESEAKTRRENAATSEKLAAKEAALLKAQKQVVEYAKENEGLADLVRWALFIGVGLAVLWVLAQGLAIAARLNPAFSAASSLIHTIAAPALSFTAQRATAGLKAVGSALADIQERTPALVDRVTEIMDTHLDRDHQAEIRRAREAAK